MKITFTVRRDYLRALTVLAPATDIRYYLNGILFEVRPDSTTMVATSGTLMGALRDDSMASGPGVPADGVEFIMPIDLAKRIKAHKSYNQVVITLDMATDLITIDDCGDLFSSKTVAGHFPDWRRIIPARDGESAVSQFNPEFIAQFAKCAKILGAKFSQFIIRARGEQAAPVTIGVCPDFVGVLMPVRQTDKHAPAEYSPARFTDTARCKPLAKWAEELKAAA